MVLFTILDLNATEICVELVKCILSSFVHPACYGRPLGFQPLMIHCSSDCKSPTNVSIAALSECGLLIQTLLCNLK